MLVSDLQGKRVYRVLPEDKRERKDGTERGPRKLGRIHYPVFTPKGDRVVGFMVQLPDIAGMIRQEDNFLSFDAFDFGRDDLVVPNGDEFYDRGAAKRLGIDLDACIIFTGMDVRTKSGENLGYCSDAAFSEENGTVSAFIISEGAASTALVGNREIPSGYLLGYHDGFMIVGDDAASLAFSGGAAAKAAEVSVKVSDGAKKGAAAVKKGAEVLDEKGSKAVDKGSRALGKQLGKTKGMFSSFVSEYKKAAGDPPKKK